MGKLAMDISSMNANPFFHMNNNSNSQGGQNNDDIILLQTTEDQSRGQQHNNNSHKKTKPSRKPPRLEIKEMHPPGNQRPVRETNGPEN